MFFYIAYALFVVCSTLYTVQDFGLLLTPRQAMSVVMLALCLLREKKLLYDKYLLLYIGFISFFGLSCAFGGYTPEFFVRLIGNYLVAYIAYWSTILIVKEKQLKYLIIPLIITVTFNAIVCYFQLIGDNVLQPYLEKFGLINDERLIYYQEEDISLLGKVTFGIYSSPVVSGHMLMYATVLSMIYQQKKFNIIGALFTLTLLIGSFASQERTGFIVAVTFTIALIFMRMLYGRGLTKYLKIAIYIMLMLWAIPLVYNLIMSGESRFAVQGLESNVRVGVYSESIKFILDNPILGGYYEFMSTHKFPPHNTFLNALVYSGVPGTIFIIIILYLQLKLVVISIVNYKQYSYFLIVLGFTYVAIVLNGMTHNLSLVNADINGWFLWGAFNYTYLNERRVLS